MNATGNLPARTRIAVNLLVSVSFGAIACSMAHDNFIGPAAAALIGSVAFAVMVGEDIGMRKAMRRVCIAADLGLMEDGKAEE